MNKPVDKTTKPSVTTPTKPPVEKIDGKTKSITQKPNENVSTENSTKAGVNDEIKKNARKNDLKKRPDMVVTPEMTALIERASTLVKAGQTKAAVAREVFDKLKQLERRQIVHVFIKGCGLTKAGAGTYYQNLNKPTKP